jgi:hypothetical protein
MEIVEPLMQPQKQFENILTLIDQFIWPAAADIDTHSRTFFVFKPYPQHIKRKQIQQWASLQCSALSPFIGGEHYGYLSKAGLHLWICQDSFHGVPETAVQNILPNGSHMVAGATHHYQQTWQGGLLISCFCIEQTDLQAAKADTSIALQINKRAPWAVTRKIDQQLQKQSTWLAITLFISLCGGIWQLSGYLTLSMQLANATQQIAELQEALGEKLATQSQLQNQQRGLSVLQNWHAEFGFLPETFAAVASKINLQGEWQANTIAWQNRTLTVEVSSKKLNIATLVTELEQAATLSNINIRPHLNDNTWILEVSIK